MMPTHRYETRGGGQGSIALPVCPECGHGDYLFVYRNYDDPNKREMTAFRCAECKQDLDLDISVKDFWIVGLWNVADEDYEERFIGTLAKWEPSKGDEGTKARAERSPYVVRE